MNIRRKYILLLTLTLGVLIFNQIIIQYYLYQKKYDAQIINIAGKQRMLSQRINLEIYKLVYNDFNQKSEQKKLIHDLFNTWQDNHNALLKGEKEKGIQPINVQKAIIKLHSITKNIDFIASILSIDSLNSATLEEISSNQMTFLSEMDKTVSILENDSTYKLRLIIGVEILFLFLSLTMIFLEFKLIVIPTIEGLNAKNSTLKTQYGKLKKYHESNSYLSKFSQIVAHDLKAPMRAIVSFGDLLSKSLSKEKLKTTQKEYLEFIMTSVRQMSLLIDDLSRFVRLEDNKLTLELFDLSKLLTLIKLQLKEQINEKGAIITFENIPLDFVADKIKLKMIFQNLIANAIKYSKDNITPKITISCTEYEDDWEFQIKDNGIGIDEKYHQDIFEIFVKLNHDKEQKSSGIGLALVKKAVEQHLGNMKVISTVGEGSTFIFSIAKFDL